MMKVQAISDVRLEAISLVLNDFSLLSDCKMMQTPPVMIKIRAGKSYFQTNTSSKKQTAKIYATKVAVPV